MPSAQGRKTALAGPERRWRQEVRGQPGCPGRRSSGTVTPVPTAPSLAPLQDRGSAPRDPSAVVVRPSGAGTRDRRAAIDPEVRGRSRGRGTRTCPTAGSAWPSARPESKVPGLGMQESGGSGAAEVGPRNAHPPVAPLGPRCSPCAALGARAPVHSAPRPVPLRVPRQPRANLRAGRWAGAGAGAPRVPARLGAADPSRAAHLPADPGPAPPADPGPASLRPCAPAPCAPRDSRHVPRRLEGPRPCSARRLRVGARVVGGRGAPRVPGTRWTLRLRAPRCPSCVPG